MTEVRVSKLSESATIPAYMTSGAAGCDAVACLEQPVTLSPGGRAAVSTGLAFEIPMGFEIQVRPRSGLAIKSGVTVVNAPGTIDSDYRGEVKVLLVNLGSEAAVINHGDRIAQFILAKVERIEWALATELTESKRGAGGFGSTGVKAAESQANPH